jgi:hypothetical protein
MSCDTPALAAQGEAQPVGAGGTDCVGYTIHPFEIRRKPCQFGDSHPRQLAEMHVML